MCPTVQFYKEVLSETTDPFEMRNNFQEKYARDPNPDRLLPQQICVSRVSSIYGLVLGNLCVEVSVQDCPRWSQR